MTSFFLFALLLLTLVLGRWRQLGTRRFSRLIPGMTFFRVALSAALISRILIGFGVQGDFLNWITALAKMGLHVALVELLLDLTWAALAQLDSRGLAPPRILKDLAFAAAALVVIGAFSPRLDLRQFLVVWLSSLVQALPPRSAIFLQHLPFKWKSSFRLGIG